MKLELNRRIRESIVETRVNTLSHSLSIGEDDILDIVKFYLVNHMDLSETVQLEVELVRNYNDDLVVQINAVQTLNLEKIS